MIIKIQQLTINIHLTPEIAQTIAQNAQDNGQPLVDHGQSLVARCPLCGWQREVEHESKIKRVLAGHYHYCPGPQETSEFFEEVAQSLGFKRNNP